MVYDPASHTFKKADAVIDSATLSGVISDGEGQTGSTLIINDGTSGTLIMTAVNTYTGTTTVMGGTLALSGDGSIATSRQVDLHNTTIFDISGVTAETSMITTLTFTNAGIIYANTLSNTGGVFISTDTVNASTSVTNAATMKVRGVMKTSTVTNRAVIGSSLDERRHPRNRGQGQTSSRHTI